jgi:phosphoserine aminotransferase
VREGGDRGVEKAGSSKMVVATRGFRGRDMMGNEYLRIVYFNTGEQRNIQSLVDCLFRFIIIALN